MQSKVPLLANDYVIVLNPLIQRVPTAIRPVCCVWKAGD